MSFNLIYKQFGACSILIEWPSRIDEKLLRNILSFKHKITNFNIKEIVYINNAYNSILINYKKINFDLKESVIELKEIYIQDEIQNKSTFKLWKIPVCYDDFFGIDIEELSAIKNISKEEIIKLHSQTKYTVYFIGFLPGFLYLGGLDEKLHIPRKRTPRLKIEKGAVAIGGNQTGVYPSESPGGWNIIGNTPISFFNTSKDDPCFASSGDKIQFIPVSLKKYKDIKTLVEAGVYQMESEVIND